MIAVENLTKRYPNKVAIDNVSFTLEKGEILGFLGPNGAGKTTTMRCITGYMPSTSGTVKVDGFDVFEQPLEVRRRIGYLPENPPLYPEMTVEGYLRFVAKIKGVPKARLKDEVESAMNRVSIAEVRERIISKLSKGFKQRVGLAQALLNDPKVLVLDEPTIGLDPKQILEVRELIKGLAGNHTVILSTHILPEVEQTCSRVIIIAKGKIVAEGSPSNLTNQLKGAEQITVEAEGTFEAIRGRLNGLAGVMDVRQTSVSDGRVRFVVESQLNTDIRREVARSIVEGGFGLLEMQASRMTLEDIFLQLTTQDEAATHA